MAYVTIETKPPESGVPGKWLVVTCDDGYQTSIRAEEMEAEEMAFLLIELGKIVLLHVETAGKPT